MRYSPFYIRQLRVSRFIAGLGVQADFPSPAREIQGLGSSAGGVHPPPSAG